MRSPLLICMTLAAVNLAQGADLALVGAEEGHAMLASFRGNCYAIMPDHVATADSMSLITALPQTFGMATIFERLPEQDLALALVHGDVAAQCGRTWESLPRDVSTTLSGAQTAGLSRIQFDGQYVDRAAADIIDVDDNRFVAVTSDRWANPEIMTGISGAVIFVGGVPVGMALSSPDTSRARFLRMDRIVALLDPLLRGDRPGGTPTLPQAVVGEGMSYRISGQVRLDSNGGQGLSDGLHVDWTGAPVAVEFTLSDLEPVALSRILIETTPRADGSVTFPQHVLISVDRGRPDRPFWMLLAASDMNPLGQLEILTGGTTARRVRVQVESVWHPDRPMQIDRVRFE